LATVLIDIHFMRHQGSNSNKKQDSGKKKR